MGLYLNSRKPHNNYQEVVNSTYFVDKTGLLEELIPLVGPGSGAGANDFRAGQSSKCICITRPRRFGKTLNMSMLEKFFSVEYAGRGDLFEGLCIWQEEKYRSLQGSLPVIFLSFSPFKSSTFRVAR